MNPTISENQKANNSEPSLKDVDIQSTLDSLRKLLEGDEEEQRETLEYLRRVLDEDRPSERKLFK